MNLAAVAIGGLIGAILRYGIASWIVSPPNAFPAATLLINWIGCFALGWLLTLTSNVWNIPHYFRLGLGTGLIGSFTTFSTFSIDTIALFQHGAVLAALLYVVLSVAGGIGLTAAGWKLALLQGRPRRRKELP